jgi:hypothetical protein
MTAPTAFTVKELAVLVAIVSNLDPENLLEGF